ncbi:MAG TPA: DNA integrity scanning diadenylate cyclase DisA [Candidatus Nanopelagicales bacterium]|nr:DNA integrity scanning diadenylate cyclase DisA [Candidatus Nanopelagicales bacterium]
MPSEKTDVDAALRAAIAAVAPGTVLRDGLERILRGRTGGLVVLGHDRTVEAMASGGFAIDAEFSAQRLRELAKMDGAVICDADGTRLLRAAVQLLPDPSIPTDEQGTRHRTADRVAKQTGFPVVSVSKSMNTIALYLVGRRHVLEDSGAILARANQALATLERYKMRLDEVSGTLSALEIEDLVTVRDVASVAQRLEMVRRIASEIVGYLVELGTDGRLLSLQLDELVAGVETDRILVIRDYQPSSGKKSVRGLEHALSDLDALSATDLLDLGSVARAIGFGAADDLLDSAVSPRGFRLLARVPRLPEIVNERLVGHFGGLQKLLAASIDDLQAVEGVGEARARSVREGLSRLAESSILERYV